IGPMPPVTRGTTPAWPAYSRELHRVLEQSRRRPAVDRDRRALDLAGALRAQEQRKLGDVLGPRDPAQSVGRHRPGPDLLRRDPQGLGALAEQLLDPRGLGCSWVNHVDVDAVALAERRK